VLLVLVMVAARFFLPFWSNSEKTRAANRAIDAAVAACSQHSVVEIPQRMAEAEVAIKGLEAEDWALYSARLDNQLILLGCKGGQIRLNEKREWVFGESASPMDGAKTQTLSMEATDTDLPGYADGTLIIRCKAGKRDLYVVTGKPAEVEYGVDTNSVRIRLDGKKPITQHWSESEDHEALFAPEPEALAHQMAEAHTMLLEYTPFQETKKLIRFSLEGLNSQIEKVATPCREIQAARDGKVVVISWPQGAVVSIDGEGWDESLTTPVTVILKPGAHQINITKPGYQATGKSVVVKPGLTTEVEITLVKMPY
jgi:hypothetical protein